MPSVTIGAGKLTYSTVIYVETTGSDTNPGTKDKPVVTLRKAIALTPSTGAIIKMGRGKFKEYNDQKTSIGRPVCVKFDDKEYVIVGEGRSTILELTIGVFSNYPHYISGEGFTKFRAFVNMEIQLVVGVRDSDMCFIMSCPRSNTQAGIVFEKCYIKKYDDAFPIGFAVSSYMSILNSVVDGSFKKHSLEPSYKSTCSIRDITYNSPTKLIDTVYTFYSYGSILYPITDESIKATLTFNGTNSIIGSNGYLFDWVNESLKPITMEEFETKGSSIQSLKDVSKMISKITSETFTIYTKETSQYKIEE